MKAETSLTSDSSGRDDFNRALCVAVIADLIKAKSLAAIVISNEFYMRSIAGELVKAFREDGILVGLIVDPELSDQEWYLILAR